MHRILVLLAILLVVSRAKAYEEIDDSLIDEESRWFINMDDIIKLINSANTTWTAGQNFAPDTPLSYYKRLAGTILERGPLIHDFNEENVDCGINIQAVPKHFDARNIWTECTSISHIYDQGICGSSWAIGAASAFTDRVCIQSGSKKTKLLSSQFLISCCAKCANRDGCRGGYAEGAWKFIETYGLVTGGDYNSREGCQPYLLQPCDHHVDGGGFEGCDKLPWEDTPKCIRQCSNAEYSTAFKNDLHRAKNVRRIRPAEAMKEIYDKGPIQTTFEVYEDFYIYKSGIYKHKHGGIVGYHSVRVIGWGEEKGIPYWIATNSWNIHWGDKGTFKILRGANECAFENYFIAGDPR